MVNSEEEIWGRILRLPQGTEGVSISMSALILVSNPLPMHQASALSNPREPAPCAPHCLQPHGTGVSRTDFGKPHPNFESRGTEPSKVDPRKQEA